MKPDVPICPTYLRLMMKEDTSLPARINSCTMEPLAPLPPTLKLSSPALPASPSLKAATGGERPASVIMPLSSSPSTTNHKENEHRYHHPMSSDSKGSKAKPSLTLLATQRLGSLAWLMAKDLPTNGPGPTLSPLSTSRNSYIGGSDSNHSAGGYPRRSRDPVRRSVSDSLDGPKAVSGDVSGSSSRNNHYSNNNNDRPGISSSSSGSSSGLVGVPGMRCVDRRRVGRILRAINRGGVDGH